MTERMLRGCWDALSFGGWMLARREWMLVRRRWLKVDEGLRRIEIRTYTVCERGKKLHTAKG